MSFSNWKTIYCILIIMVMIATNLAVTGSKMNREMFFDLRQADLQDLFPSAEEFSFRKKIFDFLEDVVSTICQREKYIMFEKAHCNQNLLSLAFTQNFANVAEDLPKKTLMSRKRGK